jgi:hypothetical protein
MDQNRNGIAGEDPEDRYTATFTIQGPKITASSPATSLEPLQKLTVTFNEPIDLSSFTPAKIASFSGPGGPLGIDLISVVPGTNNTQFDIWFQAQARTGTYTMVIGPDIRDLSGNQMDQNGNLNAGEIPDDQFTAIFKVGGLKITTAADQGTLPTPADHVRLTFNEPVIPATFTTAQVVSLTGPHGAINVTGVSTVPLSGNTQFDVAFAAQSAAGMYTLVVGPHIRDIYGNEMDQNGNFIPGEDPGDRFTTTFSLAGPVVTSASPSGNARPPVDHVRLTFNEPMVPATFTTDLVTFMGPGGPIDIADVQPVAGSNNTQFDVSFDAQTMLGAYTMVIAAGVMDTFGNIAPEFTDHFTLAITGSITTTFNSNNGGDISWNNLFDLNVLNPAGITVESLAVNTDAGGAFSISIYDRVGTRSGHELNPAGWTLVSTGTGVGAGINHPSMVNITPFTLPEGLSGIAINYNNSSPLYTDGSNTYANADVTLTTGESTSGLFSGDLFSPRTWNGTINYLFGAGGGAGGRSTRSGGSGFLPGSPGRAAPATVSSRAAGGGLSQRPGQAPAAGQLFASGSALGTPRAGLGAMSVVNALSRSTSALSRQDVLQATAAVAPTSSDSSIEGLFGSSQPNDFAFELSSRADTKDCPVDWFDMLAGPLDEVSDWR